MLEDLTNDSNLPRRHRAHLIRTLEQLQTNPELASTINSVCEDKPLRGPAADMVRATLNLPADHAAPGKGEAREALLMSLLGDLRQREVGSCFATAPAICLLDNAPEIVAGQMKALLENNKLTIRSEGVEVEVPLNQHISRAQAQVRLTFNHDGTCYRTTAGEAAHAPYKLHETPGMQGALTALGIPPDQMENVIMTALSGIGLGSRTYSVSCEEILEELVCDYCPDDVIKGLAFALNAFDGKTDVRLLRAWEYTLASSAEIHTNSENIDEIAIAALVGKKIAGTPEPPSLALRSVPYQRALSSDTRFGSTPIAAINQQLFSDVHVLMRQRFCQLFDADVEHNTIANDGVSRRGGYTLYDRVPADDPSRWKRIGDPETFQAAMTHLVEEASNKTSVTVGRMGGDPKTNRKALQLLTQNLTDNIGTNAFIEDTVHNMTQIGKKSNLPWTRATGGQPELLLKDLGAETVVFANGATAGAGGPPKLPGDATHVIEFFCGALKQMEPALREKASRTHPDFKVPVSSVTHTFSFLPMAFKEAWLDGDSDPQQWIHDKLKQPALEHLHVQRTEPPLFTLLQSMGKQLGANQPQINHMYQQIASQGVMRRDGQSYTLSRVQLELETYCTSQPDSAILREQAEDLLASMVPVPTIPFADTNWSSETGEAVLVEASYNPFKGRVETHFVNDDGSNRRPVRQTWLDGSWELSTPLAPAV